MDVQAKRDLILWSSVLAGPVFWLCSFQAKFSWNTWSCSTGTKVPLMLFSALAFALTACAGLLAWRQWQKLGGEQPGESGDPATRSRFMALGGVVLSAGFCLVILAQSIPDWILGACQ